MIAGSRGRGTLHRGSGGEMQITCPGHASLARAGERLPRWGGGRPSVPVARDLTSRRSRTGHSDVGTGRDAEKTFAHDRYPSSVAAQASTEAAEQAAGQAREDACRPGDDAGLVGHLMAWANAASTSGESRSK